MRRRSGRNMNRSSTQNLQVIGTHGVQRNEKLASAKVVINFNQKKGFWPNLQGNLSSTLGFENQIFIFLFFFTCLFENSRIIICLKYSAVIQPPLRRWIIMQDCNHDKGWKLMQVLFTMVKVILRMEIQQCGLSGHNVSYLKDVVQRSMWYFRLSASIHHLLGVCPLVAKAVSVNFKLFTSKAFFSPLGKCFFFLQPDALSFEKFIQCILSPLPRSAVYIYMPLSPSSSCRTIWIFCEIYTRSDHAKIRNQAC